MDRLDGVDRIESSGAVFVDDDLLEERTGQDTAFIWLCFRPQNVEIGEDRGDVIEPFARVGEGGREAREAAVDLGHRLADAVLL
ncbi:MAG: hypothetical protein ACTMIY_09100 [Microbacterium gubbeenense]